MLLFFALACGPEPVTFTLSPAVLEFGTVSFPPEMPDGGYATTILSITNDGETEGTLTLPEPDLDIFCLGGFSDDAFPVALGDVGPGSTYQLQVALCGYPPGSADTLVSTSFDLQTSGDPGVVEAPVEFTPDRVTE